MNYSMYQVHCTVKSNYQLKYQIGVKINTQIIIPSDQIKYLGIVINNSFNLKLLIFRKNKITN